MGCKVEGCTSNHRSRGYCSSHYQRWRKHGDPLFDGMAAAKERRKVKRAVASTATEKRCKVCNEVKPLSAFYKRGDWIYRNCKACHKNRMDAIRLQRRLENPPTPRVKVDHGNCAFEGCVNKAMYQLKGRRDGIWYCSSHYQQDWWGTELHPLRPYGESYMDERFRRCTTCLTVKTHDGFNKRTRGVGLQSECKTCAYKRVRFNTLLRLGRIEDAQSVFDSMPARLQEKLKNKMEEAA